MLTTQIWADSLAVTSAPNAPPVPAEAVKGARSAREIAVRAVILQGVVAKSFGVESRKILDWFDAQKISRELTSRESAFLDNKHPSKTESLLMNWHCEAEWALLWMIGKVDALGLPTTSCDMRRLVDEIMPEVGGDIKPFLKSATLRSEEELAGENQRTLTLWRSALSLKRDNHPLPGDLIFNVLYERRYAFEWREGDQEWDKVACEA